MLTCGRNDLNLKSHFSRNHNSIFIHNPLRFKSHLCRRELDTESTIYHNILGVPSLIRTANEIEGKATQTFTRRDGFERKWKMKIIIVALEKETARKNKSFAVSHAVNTSEFDWLRYVAIVDDN